MYPLPQAGGRTYGKGGDVPGELHFDDISTHPVMNWPMSGDVSQFNDVMQPISGDIGGFQ